MLGRNFSNLLRPHRFAAIALALWLSGLSCLLCCCAEPSEQSDKSPCQKECCILEAPLADLPLAPQLIQSPGALPVATWRFASPDQLTKLPFTTGRFRLPDQRETYLQCCVFLI